MTSPRTVVIALGGNAMTGADGSATPRAITTVRGEVMDGP